MSDSVPLVNFQVFLSKRKCVTLGNRSTFRSTQCSRNSESTLRNNLDTLSQSSSGESCLQNTIIIQKILNHRSPDSMDNLKLRLINKSFNSAVLHQIRTFHRSIRMEVPGAQDYRLLGEAGWPVNIGLIHVNKHCVKTERIFDYLGFLKEVAKVKVKHLVMINIWATVPREEWRKHIHDKIHELLNKERLQTFIGMRDLCHGNCKDCYYTARNPSEYGPIQLAIGLYLFRNKGHFHHKKLIIDELDLQWIVDGLMDDANESAKRLLRMVPAYVLPLISCDQLCLKIGEFDWKSEQRPASTNCLPSLSITTLRFPIQSIFWVDDSIAHFFPKDSLLGTDSSEEHIKSLIESVIRHSIWSCSSLKDRSASCKTSIEPNNSHPMCSLINKSIYRSFISSENLFFLI